MNRLIWSLIIVAACIAAFHALPAEAQVLTLKNFGKDTATGISPSAPPPSQFYKRASRYTLTESGTARYICVYAETMGFYTALFEDANGKPGKLVAWAGQAGSAAGDPWRCSFSQPVFLRAGTYWVAVLGSSDVRTYSSGSGQDTFIASGGFSTVPPPSQFDEHGNGVFETGKIVAFVRYYPEFLLPVAGRTTIGGSVSQPMTPDQKRVSSFDLPVKARIYGVSAYLDSMGFGEFTDSGQDFLRVIYKDANGVPGALVYQDPWPYPVGPMQPPQWWSYFYLDAAYQPIIFEPGRYWIGLMSSAPYGADPPPLHNILRYYYDHSGHWYGNADVFDDGPSSPFGPGTAKPDRISAFVHYRPVTATDSVGRTDIGTAPEAVPRDVMKFITVQTLDGASTLTGMRAYLDGNNRTSGNQLVRMVLYGTKNASLPRALLAKSDTVVIPAGMPARWVDFKVPAVTFDTALGHEFFVGIQGGGGNPTARVYGDLRGVMGGQTGSRPDTFADGPDAQLENGPFVPLQTFLSVYATYKRN